MSTILNYRHDLAVSELEASTRAREWAHKDPFGDEVEPSLLSRIEIEAYARATSLIFPFDPARLKTSSYEGRIGDRAYLYEDGRRREILCRELPGGLLEIKANSIIFIESDVTFFLPLYLGLRFNLQILHVHRGLLLGTGPLIDPGYSGKILIPLHNLTSEPHHIHIDEGFIWIEFTKTTYKQKNDPKLSVKFPDYKSGKDAAYWLNKASFNKFSRTTLPINTSIPKALLDAKKSEAIAIETRSRLYQFSLAGVVGIFIAALAIYLTFYQSTYEQVEEARVTVDAFVEAIRKDISAMSTGISVGQTESRNLAVRVDQLQIENSELRRMYYSMLQELNRLNGMMGSDVSAPPSETTP